MSISADIAARAAERLGVQCQIGLRNLDARIGRHSTLVHARLFPKPARNFDGIEAGGLPPGAFVASVMRGPVMHAAERHREFIARLAAQRAWLHVAQMMGVGWFAAADEAWLLHDIAKVVAAAIAPRGTKREEALIDPLCRTSVGSFGNVLLRPSNLRHRSRIVRERSHIG